MSKVSVVIPTLGDRPGWRTAVASAIDSARACEVELEVVLVWQGDDRPDVPEGVVVLPIRNVGVSYARNRGAERATAPLLAYLDDDEIVDDRWATQVIKALDGVDAAFGPIEPIDEDGRPHCPTEFGDSRIVEAHEPPWSVGSGGNMSFRRRVLLEVGGFDLHFGTGAIGRSAEETDLIWRLQQDGRQIRWAAEMVVYHPTKTDEEIAASRYPYGFGSGRLLRRTRSPRLIATYLHAVASANLSALRGHNPAARREAWEFGRGLVHGLAKRRRWISPDLAGQQPPTPIRAALGQRSARPQLASWGLRPHFLWDCEDAFLHAYIGPSEAQLAAPAARERILAAPGAIRVPPILAHLQGQDVLWVLEAKVSGEPLGAAAATEWWAEAAEWVVSYTRPEGPAFATTPEWSEDARFAEAAPAGLRDALDAALRRLGELPTGPCHGDLQPKNLVRNGEGIAAVDWEWCTDRGIRGLDLLFLATTHAGLKPDRRVVEALLREENPAFGDVLGPLAELGIEGPVLKDTLLVLLVKWAANERRSIEAFGAAPRPPTYGELLEQAATAWDGPATRTAAG
jgi:GT2 family glycosyltransferase